MALVLVAACSTSPIAAAAHRRPPDEAEGCGPVAYAEVRGRAPSYGPRELARFGSDHALCAGVWLPGADDWLVPQGMAIADDTAYVAGFDGTQGRPPPPAARSSRSPCAPGSSSRRQYPVRGQVGPREPTECRHGGGVLVDEHGLWLAETQRLWLLDPATLAVQRGWAVEEPVRGSFAVWGRKGELGLGRFRPAHPARLWLVRRGRVARVVGVRDPGLATRCGRSAVPPRTQGAVWAELGGVGPGLWFATSTAACGVLVGTRRSQPRLRAGRREHEPGRPGRAVGGQRVGITALPAQGTARSTPMLARFDTADVQEWRAPDCSV